MASQKCIILRLRVSDFDGEGRAWQDYPDAVTAFLIWYGRSADEYGHVWVDRKHYAHVEPFQAIDVPQKRFHILLDMEYKSSPQYISDDTLTKEVPHEIYRIVRNPEGKLEVKPFQNQAEARNLISKIREYSDVFYAWGKRGDESSCE